MPYQLLSGLRDKKLAVKSCVLGNAFVPTFVCKPLNKNNYFDGSRPSKKLPDGTIPTTTSTSLDYMIGFRTIVTEGLPYSYSAAYISFDPNLNDGKAETAHDNNYYYVYSLGKLCSFLQKKIVQHCGLPSPFGCFFNYDAANNVFVLNIDANHVATYDIIVNKAFVDAFPFGNQKISEDLYVLTFDNIMPIIINNIVYNQLSSYIPYDFVPFDSVVLATNMNVMPLTIYTNPSATPFEFQDSIIFSFDRMSSQLNFRDFYYVQNQNIISYVSFAQNTNPTYLTFNLYLFNSRTTSRIYCNVGNDSYVNFEFLLCSN